MITNQITVCENLITTLSNESMSLTHSKINFIACIADIAGGIESQIIDKNYDNSMEDCIHEVTKILEQFKHSDVQVYSGTKSMKWRLKRLEKLLKTLEKHKLRTSETHFVAGMWQMVDEIESQLIAGKTDEDTEGCVVILDDALQHRLNCILVREAVAKGFDQK